MALLKVDPLTGQSLDKAKTPEQIAAETAANERFYAERKKRIKSPKKKKPTEIIEDVKISVNPFTGTNSDPVVNEMIEPFNKLLKDADKFLKTATVPFIYIEKPKNRQDYHIILNRPKSCLKVIYNSDYSTNTHIPQKIEYIPTYSTIPQERDIFQIDFKTKVEYTSNIVVDSVWFNALDVKEMLKHPKESKKLLLELIQRMYNEMVVVKYLKYTNKYVGTTVASINIPGQKNQFAINFKDEYLEIRLWSDITEII